LGCHIPIPFFFFSPSDNRHSSSVLLEQEKLYEWILRQHENGLRLTVADIASHIQVAVFHFFSFAKFMELFIFKT
jgi:hypothetical protein